MRRDSVEDIREKLDNYVDVHGDEHKIAEKLNIPFTTVIRKYDEYKKVYDSILKKERDIEEDNFFRPGTKQ